MLALGRAHDGRGQSSPSTAIERHIHLLAPLAFLSPRIIAAIADEMAPAVWRKVEAEQKRSGQSYEDNTTEGADILVSVSPLDGLVAVLNDRAD